MENEDAAATRGSHCRRRTLWAGSPWHEQTCSTRTNAGEHGTLLVVRFKLSTIFRDDLRSSGFYVIQGESE